MLVLIFYKEVFQVLGGDKSYIYLHQFLFSGTLHDSAVKHFGHQGWVGLLVT